MNKKNLNVLIITARADFGGGPEHIYSLLKALHKNNNFYVACPDDIPYKRRFTELLGENKIILIPHRKFKFTTLLNLKAFTKKNSINVIHSHGKGAGIYGRLLSFLTGIPCVHTFHGFHTGNYNHIQKYFYRLIEKILSLLTKKIISVSKGELEILLQNKISSPSKITIIENAVEIPAQSISEQNFSSKPKIITTFTRFNYQKNSSQLIEIFKELKERKVAQFFKLALLGSGGEETEIRKMAKENGLNEIFVFSGTVENPGKYLEDSFCYISTSRWEGMPLAVLEAMSYGVPVIATNVIGNNDLVEDNKTGFLYNLESSKEAADFIIKLSEDFKLWKSFVKESREKIIKRFSLERMAKETEDIYNSVVR